MGLLDSARKVANERLEQDMRNRIQDIVRSYRHFWDPFAELIQNAVDAINRRYGVLNDPGHYLYTQWHEEYGIGPDPGYKGRITIEIWPEQRKLRVSDNGVGIRKEILEPVILPEGSDKKPGKEYGYKGKGLTYAAFISKSFQLKTRFFAQDKTHVVALDGLIDWLVSENNGGFPSKPLSGVTESDEPLPSDINTEVSIVLTDDYDQVFPAISSLNYTFDLAKAEKPKGLEVVLRTKTAVGNTRVLFGKTPVAPIEVTLVVYSGEGHKKYDIPYRYYHPREHDEFSARSYSFEQYVAERMRVGFDGNFRCMYFRELERQIGVRSKITCDFHVSALSSTRLSHVNDDLGLVGPGLEEAALTYGVHLAISGMPTGIRIDDWGSNKGHELRRYLVIADASGQISNELDAGRKGISGTRAQQISDEAAKLRYQVTTMPDGTDSDRFASYASKFLDWGRPERVFEETTDFEDRLEAAIQTSAQHKDLDPELYDRIRSVSSLEHFPMSEEEVRVLFHELLAKNKIKGYRTVYASGSRALYDSALEYELELRHDNLYPRDPLGFSQTMSAELQRSRNTKIYSHAKFHTRWKMMHPQLCVEFKPSLDSFLQEVVVRPSKSAKRPGEIDLLIVWSDEISSSVPQDAYTLADMQGDRRILYGVTHRLGLMTPEATELQCIVLKSVLKTL